MPSLVLLPVPSSTIPHEDTTLILMNWSVINCCFPPRRQQGDVSKVIRQRCHIPPTKVTFTLLWIHKFPRDDIHTWREKMAQKALEGSLLFLSVSDRQILRSQTGWKAGLRHNLANSSSVNTQPSHLGLQAKENFFPDPAKFPPHVWKPL